MQTQTLENLGTLVHVPRGVRTTQKKKKKKGFFPQLHTRICVLVYLVTSHVRNPSFRALSAINVIIYLSKR